MTSPSLFPVRIVLVCLTSVWLCQAAQHPTRIDENTNCLECHADKMQGQHVHPALKKGCTSCHLVENKGELTDVSIRQSEPVICFSCHQQISFPYSHFSYATGNCLRCHDPHASANPRLLKAKVNDLCLGCHLRTPQSVPSRYLPTVALSDNNTTGHPYAGHPVSGKADPLRGTELCCISCHMPHGGGKIHLLRMGGEIPEDAINQNTETADMCTRCHRALWGLDGGASGGKRSRTKKDK
ncbi:MAG: cytochrome c3 family protein [Candidatus Sulfotelmatobacter sp.]